MSEISERNLALFIDFDNVALGARDSRMRFDVRLLMQRVLEKGKVVVKRAYADWHHYKEHMTPLHEAAIELIEVPAPKISGKNSADIRLVVDAIDLCYAKAHIDTFVIVSGDSDFSPLVSKLRENDKGVIGIGVRSSSSHLLISNCDEFLFYDDIYQSAMSKLGEKVSTVPGDKRQLFDFLLQTTQSLLQESRGVLYSSLVKDTMKRKQPDFNEVNYGFGTFGELLEEARDRGLLEVERDSRAGGTLVVLGLGKGEPKSEGRSGRARRRRGGRDRTRKDDRRTERAEAPAPEAGGAESREPAKMAPPPDEASGRAAAKERAADRAAKGGPPRRSGRARRARRPGRRPRRRPPPAKAKTARTTKKKSTKKAAKKTATTTAGKTAKKTAKKAAKKATKKATKKAASKTRTSSGSGDGSAGDGAAGDGAS